MRVQPLLKQAAEAGSSLGSGARRIARHVACRALGGSRHSQRFHLGLVKHGSCSGGAPGGWSCKPARPLPAPGLGPCQALTSAGSRVGQLRPLTSRVCTGWQLIVRAPLELQNKLPMPSVVELFSAAGSSVCRCAHHHQAAGKPQPPARAHDWGCARGLEITQHGCESRPCGLMLSCLRACAPALRQLQLQDAICLQAGAGA